MNNDDLDKNLDLDIGDDDSFGIDDDKFEDFQTGQSLKQAWKENPLVKIGIIVAAFVTIVAGVVLFGGKETQTPTSFIGAGSDVSNTPGNEEVSPSYREAVQEENAQRVEQALRDGGSALPVPVSPPLGRLRTLEEEQAEDPLARWRKIQEERQAEAAAQSQQPQQPVVTSNVVPELATAMSDQMQSILDVRKPVSPQYMQITPADFLEKKREQALAAAQAQAQETASAAAAAAAATPIEILVPAGTIEYAQLITEANSDAPGPILAQILSGPLAGSRMIGSFSAEEEYLVLNFTTVVIDGLAYPITAVALDADTANPGLVTDIDRRYFRRVILPAAAAFVEGMGSAIAESGTTTVTVDGGAAVSDSQDLDTRQELFKGVEEAANQFGEILDEDADSVEPLIRVRAGTAMGIFFTEPVTKGEQGAAAP